MGEGDPPLQGQTFVFTGEMTLSRNEARSKVIMLGGRVTQSVSSKTTYLVAGAEAGPSKLVKARDCGIEILDEESFIKLLGENERKTKREVYVIPKEESILFSASLPWSEKYRPQSVSEIVGNKQAISELEEFMKGKDKNKAALVSGPPGIGKTTAVYVLARKLGYEIIEFNASDVRNKRSVNEKVSPIVESASIFGGKKVLIMDEVDGMVGDRGGIPELVRLIKKTQIPIICICNDRIHPKMRILANYCLDIRFRKPDGRCILSRAKEILKKEVKGLGDCIINEIINRSGGDIRGVMVGLQTVCGSSMPIGAFTKTTSKALFDGASEMFRKATIEHKLEIFFDEYDMLPLFVHENYVKCSNIDIQSASESISLSNLFDARIHGPEQNWSILPYLGIFGCVYPTRGARMTKRIDFPSYLGQNSKRLKAGRVIKDFSSHASAKLPFEDIRLYAIPLLVNSFIDALKESNVQAALNILVDFGLIKQDILDAIDITFSDDYKAIPAKTKSAFSRCYGKIDRKLPYETAELKKLDDQSEEDEGESQERII